jgi:outer membrane protein assembly factor BamB
MTTQFSRCFQVAVAAGLVLFVQASLLKAGNWPQWRGPAGNGISTEKNLPTEWSRTKNVAWRVDLPGSAGATPAIWGDRIFLTSVDGDALVLLCLSTEGKPRWQQVVGEGNRIVNNGEGNMASPSPTTDGQHVWATMATGAIGCYTVAGKEVWKMNLQDRYGKYNIAFGMSSTPVLDDNRLYLQMIHGDGRASTQEAMVVCIEALTGEGIWKQDRVTLATRENEHSYASPIMYNDGKRKYLISHGADYTIAHRLDDGREIWRLGGLNPHDDPQTRYHPTLRFVASPAANEGMIVIPTAKDHPVFAIRGDLRGNLIASSRTLLWQRPKTPDVPSPLIKDGLVYLCMANNGNLYCIEAKTGKELYRKRTHVNLHRASPVYADGNIYLTSRDGIITVVKAGREFQLVAQNDMKESISASPAISNGTLYLRTFAALWAIRSK